jgi:hypothetical protein
VYTQREREKEERERDRERERDKAYNLYLEKINELVTSLMDVKFLIKLSLLNSRTYSSKSASVKKQTFFVTNGKSDQSNMIKRNLQLFGKRECFSFASLSS